MSDFKKLLTDAASLSIDDLDARLKAVQCEADFLTKMLNIRKKFGERTTEQIQRKARREKKSNMKHNTEKRRTAVNEKATIESNVDTAEPLVSAQSNEPPSIAELLKNSPSEWSE